jgi:hypothetical protein
MFARSTKQIAAYSGFQLRGVRSRRVIVMERTTYLYSIHVQTAIIQRSRSSRRRWRSSNSRREPIQTATTLPSPVPAEMRNMIRS